VTVPIFPLLLTDPEFPVIFRIEPLSVYITDIQFLVSQLQHFFWRANWIFMKFIQKQV